MKKVKINKYLLISFFSIFTLIGVFLVNPSIKQSTITGYIPYQIRFAKIINKSENISVLDYNEIDHGWYNYLDIIPPTKYFNKMNLHHSGKYTPYIKAQQNIIKKCKVKFLIIPVYDDDKENNWNKMIFENYKIIAKHKVKNEFKINQYVDKVLLLGRK